MWLQISRLSLAGNGETWRLPGRSYFQINPRHSSLFLRQEWCEHVRRRDFWWWSDNTSDRCYMMYTVWCSILNLERDRERSVHFSKSTSGPEWTFQITMSMIIRQLLSIIQNQTFKSLAWERATCFSSAKHNSSKSFLLIDVTFGIRPYSSKSFLLIDVTFGIRPYSSKSFLLIDVPFWIRTYSSKSFLCIDVTLRIKTYL